MVKEFKMGIYCEKLFYMLLFWVKWFRYPKISNLHIVHPIRLGHQNILRLQIPVRKPGVFQVRQSFQDLPHYYRDLFFIHLVFFHFFNYKIQQLPLVAIVLQNVVEVHALIVLKRPNYIFMPLHGIKNLNR